MNKKQKKFLLKKFLKKRRNNLLNPSLISNINNTLEENLKCSICFDLVIEPKLISCGHIFCLICIENSIFHKSNCPLCRKLIENYEIFDINIVDKAVKFWCKSKDEEFNKNYEKRIKENLNYKRKRFIKKLKINQEIDFYYKNKGWVKGKILERFKSNFENFFYKIEILQENDFIIIKDDSLKIAMKGIFSNKAKENQEEEFLENLNNNNNIIIEILDDQPFDSMVLAQILQNLRNNSN